MRLLIACTVLAVTLTALPTMSPAATHREVMFSRYMRLQFCIERSLGQGMYKRLGIETVVNKWGASEPTAASMSKQPIEVQQVDIKCRKVNELESEPRP